MQYQIESENKSSGWIDVPTVKDKPKESCDCNTLNPMMNVWGDSRCKVYGAMRSKEKSLEEKFREYLEVHDGSIYNYLGRLSDIATEHFRKES